MAAALKELVEKGFIGIGKPRSSTESEPSQTSSRATAERSESGEVEAFHPRIRAIGID